MRARRVGLAFSSSADSTGKPQQSVAAGRIRAGGRAVSFVIEANPGKEEAAPAVDDTQIRHMIADAMRGFAETLAAQMGE